MKQFSKLLALLLAVVMLAALTAACGDKKDDGKSDTTSSDMASGSASEIADVVEGESRTWGDLTVFVPSSMEMKGGDGTFDPDDPKTLWLYDKEKATNYIKVTIVDSEDNAKNNIDTTKSMNDSYGPEDVTVSAGGEWTGVAYDASGTPYASLYSVAGDKVYFIMMGGFKYDSKEVKSVLGSLN